MLEAEQQKEWHPKSLRKVRQPLHPQDATRMPKTERGTMAPGLPIVGAEMRSVVSLALLVSLRVYVQDGILCYASRIKIWIWLRV